MPRISIHFRKFRTKLKYGSKMPEDEKCARAIKKHRFKLPKPNAQQRLQKNVFQRSKIKQINSALKTDFYPLFSLQNSSSPSKRNVKRIMGQMIAPFQKQGAPVRPIESHDGVHIFCAQRKVEDLEILFDSRLGDAFGDDHHVSLQSETDQHL